MDWNKYIRVEMPYNSSISVNQAYYRGGYKKTAEVDAWLYRLKERVLRALSDADFKRAYGKIRLDLKLERKARPGQKPDTSNFRKIPQDMFAFCLGVDDSIFYGLDYPVEESESDVIIFDLWWLDEGREEVEQHGNLTEFQGPLSPNARKNYGIQKLDLCSGFGSIYCVTCQYWKNYHDCEMSFEPAQYTDIPCGSCKNPKCPCINKDVTKEMREEEIKLWWLRFKGEKSG